MFRSVSSGSLAKPAWLIHMYASDPSWPKGNERSATMGRANGTIANAHHAKAERSVRRLISLERHPTKLLGHATIASLFHFFRSNISDQHRQHRRTDYTFKTFPTLTFAVTFPSILSLFRSAFKAAKPFMCIVHRSYADASNAQGSRAYRQIRQSINIHSRKGDNV